MKLPRVIMHNSVSLDGAVSSFDIDMGLHYELAGAYGADATLIGSDTILAGIKLFGTDIPTEEKADFIKPLKDRQLPLWIIPDTRGRLQGLLHYLRRTEYCRDIVILISESTDKNYIGYLKERNYDYFLCGKRHVDYRKALDILSEKYVVKTVMVDAGPTLNGILLEKGLVDEIHLLIAPFLVGVKSSKLFSRLGLKNGNMKLELLDCRKVRAETILLSYRVPKR